MKKAILVKIDESIISELDNISSNRTKLINDLIKQALAMRNISDRLRNEMYNAAKNDDEFTSTPASVRNLIDGLWL